jgi:MFS family permease
VTTEKGSYPGAWTAWTGVGVLMLAYVFSFVDRQILNLLVRPIRSDLGISDTQMSLLMGFSFAVFYAVCGIPLGRLADSRSRRGLVAAGVVVWSLMTAGCGLARHYWHLLLCRFGVGVGEATLSPAAYSLIADSFPKETRATAISVYSMGIYLGSGLAFVLGGAIVQFAAGRGEIPLPLLGAVRPWQLIFFILGGAGVLFSAALFAIHEPPRHGVGAGARVSVGEVGNYLRANWATVLYHNVGFALVAFASYGSSAWVPTFFQRTHGWSAGQIGAAYGGIVAVFGVLGIVSGGWVADRLAQGGYPDATMRVGLFATVAGVPFGVLFPLVGDAHLALGLLVPTVFFLSMPFGVAPAAVQEVMPNAMRGQASAVYLFVVNLLGMGVGPTGVALVTDYVFRDDQAVGYSLLIVTAAAKLGAIVLLALGLKPYRESLRRLHGLALP